MFAVERFQLADDTVITDDLTAVTGFDQAFEYPYPLVLHVPRDYCL